MEVMILTCTKDSSSSVFQRHMNALKLYTNDFEWVVIDNNHSETFNHAHEINRALSITEGKYLILLDDDFIVAPGWLDALKRLAKNAEIIGGVHLSTPVRKFSHVFLIA